MDSAPEGGSPPRKPFDPANAPPPPGVEDGKKPFMPGQKPLPPIGGDGGDVPSPPAPKGRIGGYEGGSAPYMPFANRGASSPEEASPKPEAPRSPDPFVPRPAMRDPFVPRPRIDEADLSEAPPSPPPPARKSVDDIFGPESRTARSAAPVSVPSGDEPVLKTTVRLQPARFPVGTVVGLLVLLGGVVVGGMTFLHRENTQPEKHELPPSAVVENGTLRVVSRPAGAKVLLDGQELGVTPLVLSMHPSIYAIEVRKQGYEPQHKDVGVESDKTATQTFTLSRPGTVVMSGLPSGADVLVDGAEKLNRSFTLAAGKHQLVVRVTGFQDFRQTFQVQAGRKVTLSPHLAAVVVPAQAAPPVPAGGPPQPPHTVVVMPAPQGGGGGIGPGPGGGGGHAPQQTGPVSAPPQRQPTPASGVVVTERHDMTEPSPTQTNGIPGL